MSTATALWFLDRLGRDGPTRAADVRTQEAFVRSLVDAIGRYGKADAVRDALERQLDEETARLAQMIARTGARSSTEVGRS